MVTIEQQLYICVSGMLVAWLILLAFLLLIWQQHRALVRRLNEMDRFKPYKIQRAKIKTNSDYNFTNRMITPGEELFRRGYSQYKGSRENIYNMSQDVANNNEDKVTHFHSNAEPKLKNPRGASPEFLRTVSEIKAKKENLKSTPTSPTPTTPTMQSRANSNFSY